LIPTSFAGRRNLCDGGGPSAIAATSGGGREESLGAARGGRCSPHGQLVLSGRPKEDVAAYCSNGEGWPCPAASFLKFLAPATSFLKFPVSASCSIVLGAGGLHHQWTGGNIDFESCSGNDQDGVDLGFLSTMTYSSSDNPSATLERIIYIYI
jgi:hypothetical protein